MTKWIKPHVYARFHYQDPATKQPFSVEKVWACVKTDLAQLIVTQYAGKTGAHNSEYTLVDVDMRTGLVVESADAQN